MTLIVCGVQIVPDIVAVQEKFKWINKIKLYDLITKHSKPGVILLTGDVHYAEFSETPCQSLTAGYKITDLTSSGMTHNSKDFFPMSSELISYFDYPVYTASLPWEGRNYANVRILPDSGHVQIEVRDLDGNKVLSRNFDLKTDLKPDLKNLNKNRELCKVI